MQDINEAKNAQLIIIRNNPLNYLTYMISSFLIMIFLICTIFRYSGLQTFIERILSSSHENENNFNNRHGRLDFYYRDNIDNYENENQFHNRNNEHLNRLNIHQYQRARDDNDSSNSDNS